MTSRIFTLAVNAIERGAFPRTRKWAWKRLYHLLARRWADVDWRFMNYGYLPPPDAAPFELAVEDEADRAFIGLYHQAVEGLPIEAARVLEVGSGRGGGASYLARRFRPQAIVGVDFSPATVQRAQDLSAGPSGLVFRTGDAEALPFADNSFDIVVNVESSHCYADMSAFIAEAVRVLRLGGWFCWADMRSAKMIPALDRSFAHPELALVAQTDLTEGVVRALDATDARKLGRIGQTRLLRRFLLEFAGTHGSVLYQGLRSGAVVYQARRYCKVPPADRVEQGAKPNASQSRNRPAVDCASQEADT